MKNQHEGRRDEPVVNSADAVNGLDASPTAEKAAVTGVVTDCLKLNLRRRPREDADVVTVIPALTEVVIDMEASTDDFYKVCTASGIEGFCMRKYIVIRK